MKLLMALAALMLPVAADAAVRAVFVGIDRYKYSTNARVAGAGFDDLSGAVADTRTIKAALERARGMRLDTDNGCQSSNAESITLLNDCAIKAAILNAWQRVIDRSKPGDTVILFFAGHGSRFISRDRSQASQHNSTIMAHDARNPDDPSAGDIRDEETRGIIDAAVAKGVRVVTLFDSCNSGTATRDGRFFSRSAPPLQVDRVEPMAKPLIHGTNGAYRVHLAAAGDGEDAAEVGRVGQRAGVFTTALANALVTRPNDSFADIAARVVMQVSRTTNQRQVPHAEGALRATLDGPEINVPTFDVGMVGGQLRLIGGTLVGVTAGSEFALFSGTTAAVGAISEAPLLRARVVQVGVAGAVLQATTALPADLPTRLVAREVRHEFGPRKLGLAVNDAAALAVVRQLDFVAVNPRGPFALLATANGMILRGRSGIELTTLPPAGAAGFGRRLAVALEKVARVESWLASLRSRAGLGLCVINGDVRSFQPETCPVPANGGTLKLRQPALVGVVNEAADPRHAYVLVIGPRYDVTLALPPFGAVEEKPLRSGQPLPLPPGQQLVPYEAGRVQFIGLSSDAPLPARVLEQTDTRTIEPEACLSAVARAFCFAEDGTRSGTRPATTAWSVNVATMTVVP